MIRLAIAMLAATTLLTSLPATAKERPRARHPQQLYTPPPGVTLMPLPPLTLRPGMARADTPVVSAAQPAESPAKTADNRSWLSGR